MIVKLSNGNEVILDDVATDPKAGGIQWLREYRKENAMESIIETRLDGITATFSDGAVIAIATSGYFPCSLCGPGPCEHFHAALPHWNRFRWEMAEREDSPWGPRLLVSIGIIPPYIVRPNLVTKHTRWSPFASGEEIAPGVLVWHTRHGKLFRFDVNEGHVYVGTDHPDGHTGCLICRGDGCYHVARALKLESYIEEAKKKSGA